jgi:hypothetical protein
MANIDAFAILLLEESKRFLEKYQLSEDENARTAFLHSALLLVFAVWRRTSIRSLRSLYLDQKFLYMSALFC